MGYRTITRLPRQVTTYAEAKQIHDSALPIRGRVPEVRPLGERRDCDTYKVQMNGDKVEFVLYKTPVITYNPDDTIEIKTDGWSTVSTHQMFQWVLNMRAQGRDRTSIVIDWANNKYVMTSTTVLKLKRDEHNRLTVCNAPRMNGYKMNRKALNAVKRKYSEFYEYLRTFTSLRATDIPSNLQPYHRYTLSNHKQNQVREIAYTVRELADSIGTYWNEQFKEVHVAMHVWDGLWQFPTNRWSGGSVRKQKFDEAAQNLLLMCANEQDEDNKHTHFHKAALVLLAAGNAGYRGIRADDNDLTFVRLSRFSGDHSLESMFTDMLHKAYRREILELCELKSGSVPNSRYNVWMEEL